MNKLLLFLLLLGNSFGALSQKEDYVWRLGNNGGVDTFSVPNPSFYMFDATNAITCDTSGNLLFFSNGIVVFNANNDTMLNGDSLNPSEVTTIFEPTGMRLPQADIILRKPGTSNIFYLFHETIDNDTASIYPLQTNVIYYSIIDMSLDSGRGGIISGKKNLHLYDNDTILPGKLTVVRHGNGRDWWLLSKRACYPEMIEWLVTPDSILGPYVITMVNDPNTCYDDVPGQACFSTQGNKYAIFFGSRNVYAFEMDRCSGNLTEIFHAFVSDSVSTYPYGCAFSSNGRYLYLSTTLSVFQFDMDSPNIPASMVRVAAYDGFYSPSVPFATHFSFMRIAPDNRIYVSTDYGCDVLHVIEFPDSAGLQCDVQQHSFYLPTYNVVTTPNIPDYKLRALVGSSCDTILSISEHRKFNSSLTAYPNPSTGVFTLQFELKIKAKYVLSVKDISGRLLVYITANSNIGVNTREMDLTGLASGIYFINLKSSEINETIRIAVE